MSGGGGVVVSVLRTAEGLYDWLLDGLLQLLWRWAGWPSPVRGLPLW